MTFRMAAWLGCSSTAWRPHPGGGSAFPRIAIALSRAWRQRPFACQTRRCTSSGSTLSMRVKAASSNSESPLTSESCSITWPLSTLC
eukprot:9344208-Pyramimonas_sp.AAC.1